MPEMLLSARVQFDTRGSSRTRETVRSAHSVRFIWCPLNMVSALFSFHCSFTITYGSIDLFSGTREKKKPSSVETTSQLLRNFELEERSPPVSLGLR